MLKGDRGAVFAIGLVAGLGLALFFFVWAFPWFSDPHQSASYCQPGDQDCAKYYQNSDDPHFWVSPFYGWIYAEDTLAQWIMASFGVIATGVSIFAVIYVRDTLLETRRIGEAQVRAYLHEAGIEFRFGSYPSSNETPVTMMVTWANSGQSPARQFGGQATGHIIDKSTNDMPIREFYEIQKSTVIGSGGIAAGRTNNIGWVQFDRGEIDSWIKKHKCLIVYCCVIYTDVFGRKWRAESCSEAVIIDSGPKNGKLKIQFRVYKHHNGEEEI